MMDNVLRDAVGLQTIYVTLLTNQSEASVWTAHVLDSVSEVVVKVSVLLC